MKKNLIIVLITAVSIIAVLSVGVWFLFDKSGTYYYTRIDESQMTENEKAGKGGVVDFTGGMRYLYTLNCYDEGGKEKTLTFGANKELRNGAFLKLTVRPIRGVVAWAEVQFDEMPDLVCEKYDASDI